MTEGGDPTENRLPAGVDNSASGAGGGVDVSVNTEQGELDPARRIVDFVDSLTGIPHKDPFGGVAEDGGVRRFIQASPNGLVVEDFSPDSGVQKGMLLVGTRVSYNPTPSEDFVVSNYRTMDGSDNPQSGTADYVRLLHGENPQGAQIRTVHIKQDGGHERYILISSGGKDTVFQDTSGGSMHLPLVIRHVMGNNGRPLDNPATKAAYSHIAAAYRTIGGAVNKGYQDSFDARAQSL